MDGWDRDLAHSIEMYVYVLARTRELVVYAACTVRKTGLGHRIEMYVYVLARTRELVVYAACTTKKTRGPKACCICCK